MEILVNSIDEFKEIVHNLKKDDWCKYRFGFNVDCKMVVQNAKINALGAMEMDISDVKQVFWEGESLFSGMTFVPTEMLDYYLDILDSLKKSSDGYIIKSVKLLMSSQLKVGDVIRWESGKQGIIQEPRCSHYGQIYYKLLRKDGTEGKKEFLLYQKTDTYNYSCVGREYFDYKFLSDYYYKKNKISF